MQNLLKILFVSAIFFSCQNQGSIEHHNETVRELTNEELTLDVVWNGIACDCPQWTTVEGSEKLQNDTSGTLVEDDYLFDIEAAHDSLIFPERDSLNPLKIKIYRITGEFFKRGKIHFSEEGITFRKTFRYRKFENISDSSRVFKY